MRQSLAIFGGSFDPPHVAHTLVACYVLATQPVDHVLIVPTASHPFGKALSAFAHRVRMCELAFSPLANVEICRIEETLPPPSFTLRTLEALAAQRPAAQLRLVVGSDLLRETHSWHNFARIAELAPLIVVEREGYPRPDATGPALPRISSTELRRRLCAQESTAGLLTPAVASYALAQRLYAEPRVHP